MQRYSRAIALGRGLRTDNGKRLTVHPQRERGRRLAQCRRQGLENLKCRTVCDIACRTKAVCSRYGFAKSLKSLVVCAVRYEPVSGLRRGFYGNYQGKSAN